MYDWWGFTWMATSQGAIWPLLPRPHCFSVTLFEKQKPVRSHFICCHSAGFARLYFQTFTTPSAPDWHLCHYVMRECKTGPTRRCTLIVIRMQPDLSLKLWLREECAKHTSEANKYVILQRVSCLHSYERFHRRRWRAESALNKAAERLKQNTHVKLAAISLKLIWVRH